MTILMGRWDCDACGRKGNIGDSYSCEGCGAGRPEDVEFYLTKDAEVITDAAGIRAAEAGADWQCGYCDEWVPATKSVCPDCTGGGIGGSKRHEDAGKTVTSGNYREVMDIQDEYAGNDEEPISDFIGDGDHDRVLREHAEDPPEKRSPPPAYRGSFPTRSRNTVSAGRNTTPVPALLGLGAVALVILLCIGLFKTSEIVAKVSHHTWERVQQVEEYTRGLNKDGWDHPADAYDISTSRKIHHYDKVVDHYDTEPVYSTRRVQTGTEPVYTTERYQTGSTPTYGTRTVNMGNGRFRTERYQTGSRPTYSTRRVQTGTRPVYRTERYQSGTKQVPVYRDEPVYRTYYSYKVDRWVTGTPRVLSGRGLEPQWPSTEIRDSDQRMGSRRATYLVHFIESEPPDGEQARTWSKELNEAGWRSYENGTNYILVIGMGNSLKEIKPIKVEKE